MICYIMTLLLPCALVASPWTEQVLAGMTLDQKIGQLFMVPACPLRADDHLAHLQTILKTYHVGNLIVKQSDPASQVRFLDKLQAQSTIPLLVAADAEWGLAMRMSDTMAFPRNMTLGAISDTRLIYQMGQEIGRQARSVGVHINLAPVADVNNNPANPVIHMRSFGEDPEWVAECVAAYVRGLQSTGVLACAKHFPGHGDTRVDSHVGLPIIPHSLERLCQVEFVPFTRAIQEGVFALMSAHLSVPCLDPIYPTSLSSNMHAVVRDKMQFGGVVITDALNMRAITDRFSAEEIAVLARKSGADILLYGDHIAPNVDEILQQIIPRAFVALKAAYESGELDMELLDASVRRILSAKETIERSLPEVDLHSQAALDLKRQLFQEAVTLVGGPLGPLLENRVHISIGTGDVIDLDALQGFDCVVINVLSKEALSQENLERMASIADRLVVCLFTSPYALNLLSSCGIKTILVGYENDPDAQRAVARVLEGVEVARGRLPVTVTGF